MPKKPLSMYMLYYSERREDIQKEHPHLSMPDVAKICSDEYQKLPEKKKAKYKSRCDDMRKEYDERLESFYSSFPAMRPIKTEKAAKNLANRNNMVISLHLHIMWLSGLQFLIHGFILLECLGSVLSS